MAERNKTFTDYMREADAREIPDARETYIQDVVSQWHGESPPCCAIGGANVASGSVPLDHRHGLLSGSALVKAQRMPQWLSRRRPHCPACGQGPKGGRTVVTHLYDDHFWSRTLIAKWLDATYGRNHDESDWLPTAAAEPLE